jgi:hypothetical protein
MRIVPRFPPQIDGLGDYAHRLAQHLRRAHGIDSRFLIADPAWRPGAKTEFDGEALGRRSSRALAVALGKTDSVILHFVGYGYQHRGLPFWLVGGVSRWRAARRGRRLIVVFHELWASGPPWRSEYYTGPMQRFLAAKLLRLADFALTSTPKMSRMLDAIAPGKTVLRPIPSSLPRATRAECGWHRGGPVRVAVFGRESSRLRSIDVHASLLGELNRAGLLAGVEVFGAVLRLQEPHSAEVRLLSSLVPAPLVRWSADVSPEDGAEILARSDLLLSCYASSLVCKSSAVAAALSCGCVPVLPEARDAAPLTEGREILACDGSAGVVARLIERIRGEPLAPMAEAAIAWSEKHASWPDTAARFATLLAP